MNQNRISESLLLIVVLLLSIVLLFVAWATYIYQPDDLFWKLLLLVEVGQTLLFCVIIGIWLIGNPGSGLGLRLLNRFQSHPVYIFLLLEFAFSVGTITATGYFYQKPSSAVLLSLFTALCMIFWLIFKRASFPVTDAVFAVVWGLMVLFTPGAINGFGFAYALTRNSAGIVATIALVGLIVAVIVLAFLLLVPLLLQIPGTRRRFKRMRDTYLNRPAQLRRVLTYSAVYLFIAGLLPLPYNRIGIWIAMLVGAPVAGLIVLRCTKNSASSESAQTEINSKTIRTGLSVPLIAFVVLAISSAGKQMWTWFPDMYSYLRMAQDYARGDFVVRGYWAPLMPWLLMWPVRAGIDPQVSQRFLNIGCGLIIVASSVVLARRYGLTRFFQLVVAGTVGLVFLQYSFFPGTPDVLAAVPTTLFFILLLSPWFWRSPVRGGLVAGLLIALGYYSKAYNLPFMIASLLATVLLVGVTRVIQVNGLRWRNLVLIVTISLSVLVAAMLPWISAIHNRYGVITYSTVALIANNTPTSGGIAHLCIDWAMCNNPNDVLFPWEDPLPQYYPGRSWSAFASIDNFQQEIRLLSNSVLVTFDQFPVGTLAFLALVATIISIFWFWNNPQVRFLCTWTAMIILIQLGGYISTGYTNLYNGVEFRYHLTLVPIIVVMLFWVVQNGVVWVEKHGDSFFSLSTLGGRNRAVLMLFIVGISLSTVTLPKIVTGLASPQEMIEWVKTGLPRPLPCDHIAADALNDVLVPPFAATDLVNLAISFYTDKRTLGVVRWPKEEVADSLRQEYQTIGITIPSTVEDVDSSLHEMGVKTFITVNDPDLTEQLITKFQYKPVRDLTICQMPSTVLYVPS